MHTVGLIVAERCGEQCLEHQTASRAAALRGDTRGILPFLCWVESTTCYEAEAVPSALHQKAL